MKIRVHTYTDLLTRSGHQLHAVDYVPGMTVAAALHAAGVNMGTRPAVVLSGHPVRAEELELVQIGPTQELHVATKYAGVEVVVAIAVAVVGMAASYVMARMMAPTMGTGSSEANEERRYGFNRFSNDARAGDPIPVLYGSRRYGGKVVARVPVESADGSGDSRLRILICLGWGPIQAIGNQTADFDDVPAANLQGVYLNDQDVSTFQAVKVSGRLGTDNQAPMPGFDDTETLRDVGVGGTELRNTYGTEPTSGQVADAISMTTLSAVDSVVVRVRFAAGLYSVNARSQIEARTATFRVRHRLVAGSWSNWTNYPVTRAEQSEFFASPRVRFSGTAVREVQVQRVTVEGAANDPARQDRMLWDSLVEAADTTNNYGGLAMLALEVTASEQVQSVPRISANVAGRKVRTYTGGGPGAPTFATAYSTNPAELALDLLTSTRYGMGALYTDSRVDFDTWISWREYCAQMIVHPSGRQTQRHEINVVLDTHRDGVEWLRQLAAGGRAVPVTVGGTWRWIVDRPQADPVEVFTDGSVAVDEAGKATLVYKRELTTGAVRRANRLVMQFENGQQAGQADVVAWPAQGQLWLGGTSPEQVREQSGRLDGITDPDLAMAETVYRMKRLRYQGRTVRFTTTHPVVIVQPGDRFDLASSLAGYAVASGRCAETSGKDALVLDRTLQLAAGTGYTVRVYHNDNSVETRAIATSGTVPAGGVLPMLPPLSTNPAGAEYAVLQNTLELKPYICTRVGCDDSDSMSWTVEGIEYVAGVYDADPNAVPNLPQYSTLRDPNTAPGPVRDLRVFERLVPRVVIVAGVSTTQWLNQVELSWAQNPGDAENTATFRVFRRIVGTSAWVLVPEPSIGRRAAVLEISDLGRGYQFTVVAVSLFGATLSPYDPRLPIASLAINSQQGPPAAPTGLALTQVSGNNYRLSWNASTDAVEYQVLTGRHTDAQVKNGAFDAYVMARTADTSISNLYLPSGRQCTFWVRAVGVNQRMSDPAASVTLASPAVPAGRAVANTATPSLSGAGTRTNLTHAASPTFNGATQAARLELTNPASEGTYEAPEVDLTTTADTVLAYRIGTANDTDDVAVNTNPISATPGPEADQWGLVTAGKAVGMLFPPWPDSRLAYAVEYRVHNGTTYGSWTAWPAFGNVQAVMQKYQVRVRMARGAAPYRPALTSLETVASR